MQGKLPVEYFSAGTNSKQVGWLTISLKRTKQRLTLNVFSKLKETVVCAELAPPKCLYSNFAGTVFFLAVFKWTQ